MAFTARYNDNGELTDSFESPLLRIEGTLQEKIEITGPFGFSSVSTWEPIRYESEHVVDEIPYYVVDGGSGSVDVVANSVPDDGWPETLSTFVDDDGLALCLLGSSMVATPDNHNVRVDTLRIGDNVMNDAGDIVRIVWIGAQSISCRFKCPERTMPVKIKQGSLSENVPFEDLIVTTDHAMLVDGILATAGALVNGTSITRVPLAEMGKSFKVYHIETENHEIIYANGAPTETFIDNVSRSAFDNYQEYVDLYGEEREMDELPLPRAMSPRQLPKKIKARLAARAEALGYVNKAAA